MLPSKAVVVVLDIERRDMLKKGCILLLACSLVSTPSVFGLNLFKLRQKNICVENKTSKNQKIAVVFYQNQRLVTKYFDFAVAEKKTVTLDEHAKIVEITPDNKASFIYVDTSLKQTPYVVHILNEYKNDFPINLQFDDAMKSQSGIDAYLANTNFRFSVGLPDGMLPQQYYDFIKKIYETNNIQKRFSCLSPKNGPRTPYIIHQIWFGPKMPEAYRQWSKVWQEIHPDWKYILWTESSVKEYFKNGISNQKMFDRALSKKNYAMMSDILRYEILYEFGGVYLDTDCVPYESLEFLHRAYDFYAGIDGISCDFYCANGVIGAMAHHPILKKCMDLIKEFEDKEADTSKFYFSSPSKKERVLTILESGPVLFTKAIIQCANQDGNIDIVLPPQYFYPIVGDVKPESFSMHCFCSSWLKILEQELDK